MENEIMIVRIENRKIVMKTTQNEELSGTIMEQLEILLEPLGFVKIDQSKLIQKECIREIEGNVIYFKNSDQICYIPRRHIRRLEEVIRHE
ncbi:hypothetical protein BBD42_31055 [Paenibacillus sp. BIHB 4019]|uniref:HTH LytTR-type domain-containing protein n=1 Tax=Paenibacillus sp. BIHB 4019 TaxID=1870819 RepID=A0A1B2DRU7_9BACL|nr:LytTR family transcriptional regulator DNA-binding domain-containing protein [Paenibacillus sp. BIHB 4019]ANY70443.1 hypothetical protein BBD42_31055 [Paenibacillus sp. BIHB 4019]